MRGLGCLSEGLLLSLAFLEEVNVEAENAHDRLRGLARLPATSAQAPLSASCRVAAVIRSDRPNPRYREGPRDCWYVHP